MKKLDLIKLSEADLFELKMDTSIEISIRTCHMLKIQAEIARYAKLATNIDAEYLRREIVCNEFDDKTN